VALKLSFDTAIAQGKERPDLSHWQMALISQGYNRQEGCFRSAWSWLCQQLLEKLVGCVEALQFVFLRARAWHNMRSSKQPRKVNSKSDESESASKVEWFGGNGDEELPRMPVSFVVFPFLAIVSNTASTTNNDVG
jgi:hypothetical protein